MVVWKWENGRSFPNLSGLISICNVLEVSADYLLGISEDYTPVDFLK
jgi:transcriptional regulator with XRE-family HTH domain